MRKIAALVRYSFKRKWAHPTVAIIFIAMPVLITAILWATFGPRGEEFAPLKLAVVNKDVRGFFSNFIVSMLSRPESSRWIKAEVTDEEEAMLLMKKNKVSAVLIIPENFSKTLFEGRSTELRLIKNPAHQIYPEIAEQLLITFEDAANFLLNYFGQEIGAVKKMMQGDFEQEITFKQVGVKIEKLFERISKFPLKISEKRPTKKKLPLVIYFFSGMSYFFLLFFASAAIIDLLIERKKFLFRRMMVSKLTPFGFVLYHHITSIIFLLSMEIILALLGRIFFSLKTPHLTILFLILLLFPLLFVSFYGIIMALTDEEKKASNISTVFTFIFAMAGGSFLPVQLLPGSVRFISKLSPLYYLNQATINLFLEKVDKTWKDLSVALPAALILLAISLYLNTRTCRRQLT